MTVRNRQLFLLACQISLLCASAIVHPPNRDTSERADAIEVSAQLRQQVNRQAPKTTTALVGKPDAPTITELITLLKNDKEKLSVRLGAIAALGRLGADARPAVSTLAKGTTAKQKVLQIATLDALAKIGAAAKAAVPDVVKALKDDDEEVRVAAARALGSLSSFPEITVPSLIEAFDDPSKAVRVTAIDAISNLGTAAKPAIPELIQALSTAELDVRLATITALGKLGADAKSATPFLAQALSDANTDIRLKAASALVSIGAEASPAVPQLVRALSHADGRTRAFAAIALGRVGSPAKAAVPDLTKALPDPEKDVRLQSATALGRIGLEAQNALPELVKLLSDENSEVRLGAANALRLIAASLQDKAPSLSVVEIYTAYTTLEGALPLLENPSARLNEELVISVRRSISVLKNEKDSRPFERVVEWGQANPAIAGALLYLVGMPSLWFALLLVRPSWLLKLNNALQPYTDFEIPIPMGNSIKVPLRFVLFVGWFHYHPRVLDAWVNQQIAGAREGFAHKNTVSDRKVYIPIPVVLNGNTVPELANNDLHTTFWDGRQCLLIWGEGGIGKTSLACHLAKWAMADQKSHRLCHHRMLPVLIEQELDFKLPEGKNPFREAIRGQVQALIDASEPISDDFLEKLLRQRRILVIVDRLSELSEETRQQIRPGHPDFPANALIVTSRAEEVLDEVPKTTIKPLRIEGNRLSSFLEAYLMQRSKRELFTDSEYFDACSQLSKMVGQRHITVLLATLYAEQMIGKKEGINDESALPDNIPDLMLSYLNELNRDTPDDTPDNLTVHEDAKIIAWECLQQYYRPAPAKRDVILAKLRSSSASQRELPSGSEEESAKLRLKHLEKRLRVVQALGPAQDQICFALDPLAECLAALHLVDLYGSDKALWDEWLMFADAVPGAPESIQGFLLAMRDCCLTRGSEIDIPDYVLGELGQRVGLSAETLRKSQVEQRMRRLTPLLSTGDTIARLDAIRELGELGAAAKGVLPALVRELQDRDWRIRREVAWSIGLIGSEARMAIPALIERLRDPDRRVSGEAIAALGKIGTAALPALITALESQPAYVRSTAAWVLSSFNAAAKPAIPALTAALRDDDWQVRWVAAYALGCIGPDAKSAIPVLIEAFRGEYELVSKEASRTLWRISGEAEAIVAALGDIGRGNDRN
ncbi:HEAT repeat domain-containing protein [Myxacorys almedinensis]|uniref:PBS lyase n=1 Tax=Myxacorys almedinensis A TaxID=2690445 RepID=A0A8J7YZZ3_9CYAN|nr:HEAT repeat domain-containing protein [Myxacorys almedinensis]NDJ17632.1 PBS lyase [Myxacorys almedinensis A]